MGGAAGPFGLELDSRRWAAQHAEGQLGSRGRVCTARVGDITCALQAVQGLLLLLLQLLLALPADEAPGRQAHVLSSVQLRPRHACAWHACAWHVWECCNSLPMESPASKA